MTHPFFSFLALIFHALHCELEHTNWSQMLHFCMNKSESKPKSTEKLQSLLYLALNKFLCKYIPKKFLDPHLNFCFLQLLTFCIPLFLFTGLRSLYNKSCQ